MRKMKNSGIVWIGEIPEGWGIVLLSSIFKQRKEKNINNKENNLLSLSYGKIIRKDISISDGLLPQSYETYNIINNGDIVFRLTDLQNDKRSLRTGLCKEKGIITSAYVTIKPTVELSSEYMQYLYHSYDICKVFYGMGDGVRQGMNYDDLRRLPTLFPEYEEQQQIADFLDKKCAEIDKLIDLQESMIEKLKEYKQAVITQAVTKGLDPDVPMKDSGIEWIGKISSRFKVMNLKQICEKPLQYGANAVGISYDSTLPRYVRITDIEENTLKEDIEKQSLPADLAEDYILGNGDILFARSGGTVGKSFIFDKKYGVCAFAGYLIRAIINKDSFAPFVYYYTQSFCYDKWKEQIFIQATIQNIGANKYANLDIVVPSFLEQQQIADYLDKKCVEIDDLIKLKEQKIEKLKEYKKSLIYEYVTGKKEVV